MNAQRTTCTIGDVLELQRGYDITRSHQRDGDVPVVSSGGISSFHDESVSSGPGVVIGRKGTLGKTFYLPGPFWPHDTTLWVRDFKGSHPRFVYYFFQTLDFGFLDVGSANPTLNRNHVHPLPVSWPAEEQQRAIAEVLGALDDKIAANDRLVERLELLTDALSRQLILRADPGDGDTVGDMADIVNGVSYRTSELEEGSADNLVTLKSVTRDGRYAERGLKGFRGAFRSEQRVKAGDVIVAQTDLTQAAEVVGRAVRLPRGGLGAGVAVASLDLAIVRPKGGLPRESLLAVLRDERFRQHCLAHTSGTTVLHLRRGAIASYPMPTIDGAANNDYVEQVTWLHSRQDSAAVESRALAALRDALLPELMSGRLRVKDAEKTVEEVL